MLMATLLFAAATVILFCCCNCNSPPVPHILRSRCRAPLACPRLMDQQGAPPPCKTEPRTCKNHPLPINRPFLPQELREICSLSQAPALLDVAAEQSCTAAELADVKASRVRARSFEILSQLKVAAAGQEERGLRLRFNLRPVALQGDAAGSVAAAEFEHTAVAENAASKLKIECGMFCRSIGYKLSSQVHFGVNHNIVPCFAVLLPTTLCLSLLNQRVVPVQIVGSASEWLWLHCQQPRRSCRCVR